ncbi:MAG: GntP family permease, partial [Bacteroidetes bacterium]
LGMKRVPAALLLSGFTLGIPVFFDTVFYLMFPLARALALRNTGKYALYLLAIIAGAAMAHSLVPPTPGPLFVAGELGVGIGEMIIGGILVGLFAAAAGYAYAWWSHRRWPVPLRSTAESSLEDLQARQQHKDEALPGLAFSLLPVLLPVLLIAGQTTLRTLWGTQSRTGLQAWVYDSLMLLGNSTIALSLAAGLALLLLYRQVPDKKALRTNVQEALASAGMIILITGAGGAFGSMLQQSGVGLRIQELASGLQMGVLPLAFLITALVRFAQGSATVAMITAVGIMAAMASPGSLGFHPLYLALAIGCGSKPLPWMNDSGFWIICKMSGMTETETLRHHTVMMSIMGVAGLLVTMLLAVVFPLV